MSAITVKAYWHRSRNVGDALMPQLVEKLLGRSVVFANKGPRLVLGGSILNWADKDCMVWGAGLADLAHEVNPQAEILAVRGPLSWQRALDCGATAPRIFGDPALLMPCVYPRARQPQHALGLIPHHAHYRVLHSQYSHSIPVIDVMLPVESVLAQLWSCHAVVSTSLHGLILADAYGVQSCWADMPTIPIGGDAQHTKFLDYFMSVGKAIPAPLTLTNTPTPIASLLATVQPASAIPETMTNTLLATLREALRCDSM